MAIEISLINPYTHFIKYEGSHCFPLGLLAIASIVRDIASVEIIDLNLIELSPDSFLNKICEKEIIGISCWMDTFSSVKKMCDLIKTHFPEKLIVLGGPFPTVSPVLFLEKTKADIVVVGEGEKSFREIVNRVISRQSTSDVAGTIFKTQNKFIHNEKETDISLENYRPDYQFFSEYINQYINLGNSEEIMNDTVFIFSRGCINSCNFCGANYLGNYRELPIPEIKSRINELIQFVPGTANIHFVDSNFSPKGRQPKTEKICHFLKSLDLTYSTLQRADALNQDLVNLFKETGCRRIYLGVERFSEKMLDFSNKASNVDDIIRGIELITEADISLACFIMFGMPGDSKEAIRHTIDYIKNKGAYIHPNWLYPIPGTPMFELAKKERKIKNEYDYFMNFSEQYNQDQRLSGVNLSNVPDEYIRSSILEIWEYNKTLQVNKNGN